MTKVFQPQHPHALEPYPLGGTAFAVAGFYVAVLLLAYFDPVGLGWMAPRYTPDGWQVLHTALNEAWIGGGGFVVWWTAVYWPATPAHRDYLNPWRRQTYPLRHPTTLSFWPALLVTACLVILIGGLGSWKLFMAASWQHESVIIICVLMVAGTEEVLFRGLLFTALRSLLDPVAAVIFCGLLFGAAHLPLVGAYGLSNGAQNALVAAGLGWLLTALYFRTGRLAPCILLHALIDTSGYLYFTPDELSKLHLHLSTSAELAALYALLAGLVMFVDPAKIRRWLHPKAFPRNWRVSR